MKGTSLPPTTTLTVRPASGVLGGGSTTASSSGKHYILQQQRRTGANQQQNGSQFVLRRFSSNNVVQVRRIVNQQPQQLKNIQAGGNRSSSESTDEYEPKLIRQHPTRQASVRGNILRRVESGNGKKVEIDEKDLRMGVDLDISIVRKRKLREDEDEEDEDEGNLVIDENDEDDETAEGLEIEDDEAGSEDKSALEMNGQNVDSEYLKHVIETQILNRHKTCIKDWDGTKGHMCQSCHETFLSENGLEVHRNRRILHILFFCRHCRRDLSFFNKCRLLQHLRNHRITPTVAGLQNCTMIRLLPESEYLHFKYDECTSSSDEEDLGGSTGGKVGAAGTAGGCSGSGGSSAAKRLKPSRFRRIARSSLSNNDKDSDLSPPPTGRLNEDLQKSTVSKPSTTPPSSNSKFPGGNGSPATTNENSSKPSEGNANSTATSGNNSKTPGANGNLIAITGMNSRTNGESGNLNTDAGEGNSIGTKSKLSGGNGNSGATTGNNLKSSGGNSSPAGTNSNIPKPSGGNGSAAATNGSNSNPKVIQRKEQVTVIKSTGITAPVIVKSPIAKLNDAHAQQRPQLPQSQLPTISLVSPPTSPRSSSPEDFPQIRIRNLNQLTDPQLPDQDPEALSRHQLPPQLPPQLVRITSVSNPISEGILEVKTPSSPIPSVVKVGWHCYKCDMGFDTGKDLFMHLQVSEKEGMSANATRSLHRCATDDITSWSQCQYVYHTKVFHERSVQFMCPGCGFEAQDYNRLLGHVTNDCFYISQRARYLCAASAQKCSFADKKSVKTEPEIVDHLKKEHSRSVLQCVHCTQGFATENWLIKHLADAHNIQLDESKGEAGRTALIDKATRPLTQCLICNILFPNGPTFIQHVYLNFHMHILTMKMFECQGCTAVFETSEQLAQHRKIMERCKKLDPFQMKICWSATEADGISLCAPTNGGDSSSRTSTPQPQLNGNAAQMTPTPIKIVANPAAVISQVQSQIQSQIQAPKLFPAQLQHPQPPQAQPPQLQVQTTTSQVIQQTQQPPQLHVQATTPQVIQQGQQPPQLQIQTANPQVVQQGQQPPQLQRQLPIISTTPHPSNAVPISIIRQNSNQGGPQAIVLISTSASGENVTGGNNNNPSQPRSQPTPHQVQQPQAQSQPSPQQHHTIYIRKPASIPPKACIVASTSTSISCGNTTITAINSATQSPSKNPPIPIAPKKSSGNNLPGTAKPPIVLIHPPAVGNVFKKSFFDNLLACQYCERMVVFSSLRKHEDQCCGLSTVAPGFCLSCRKNFGDRKTLARHGITHILEGLPICLFCNNRHIRPTHPKNTVPDDQENLYALKKHLYSNHTSKLAKFPFQCPICDQTCLDKRQTEFHIKDHQFKCKVGLNDPDPIPLTTTPEDIKKLLKVRKKVADSRKKVTEVFYCPVCKSRQFSGMEGLARHLHFVHQKNPRTLNLNLFKKISVDRNKLRVCPAVNPPSSSLSSNNQKPLVLNAERTLKQRPSTEVTQKNNGCSSTSSASKSNTITVTTSSPLSGSNFPARFSPGTVLRKRLTSDLTGNTSTQVVIKRPVPGILPKPPSRSSAPNTRSKPTETPLTESKSSVAKSLDSTSRTIPRPPSNFLQTRSSASAKVRRKDNTFACHKCKDFTCKTEDEFYAHVKWQHVWPESELQKLEYGNRAGMEEPSEFWCPECNTMFVAKPSLVRHLKFAHDYISNVDEYMQKIGYDGKKPLKPNQCEVCYLQCVDDRDLQQHMRTHGMAFLRLREMQRQQTDRPPLPQKSNS